MRKKIINLDEIRKEKRQEATLRLLQAAQSIKDECQEIQDKMRRGELRVNIDYQ